MRIVHSNSEPVACYAGLRHFKHRAADSVPVPNTNLIVRKSVDSEVLSKLSVIKTGPSELVRPIVVGFELIDHHGTLFAAMTLKIRLAIAIQIEPASKDAAGYGLLPNRRTDLFPLPFNLLRKTDVDR